MSTTTWSCFDKMSIYQAKSWNVHHSLHILLSNSRTLQDLLQNDFNQYLFRFSEALLEKKTYFIKLCTYFLYWLFSFILGWKLDHFQRNVIYPTKLWPRINPLQFGALSKISGGAPMNVKDRWQTKSATLW